MEEQLKIIIDKNGHIHVWNDGVEQVLEVCYFR